VKPADASGFLVAFLRSQQQAEPLASPEQAADAEYRYRVRFPPGTDPHLEVQCWRRIPGSSSWSPRLRSHAGGCLHQAVLAR